MNIDRQDVQDIVRSLIYSLVSCESFVFEFRIVKMDQQADLDSIRLRTNNDDLLGGFSKLQVRSMIIL